MRHPPKFNHRRPLDSATLEALALGYVARFAVTEAKLAAYLARKLRERGWSEDELGEPPVAALVERFAAQGYVDDAAWAKAKSGSLLRRGYGGRRVAEALSAAGVAEGLREALRPGEAAARQAALALARKRGFGPFAAVQPDLARRQKQIAAMLRAGHPLDMARYLVDAASIEIAEDWAGQAIGED